MEYKIRFINKHNPKNPIEDQLLMKKFNLSQFLNFMNTKPKIKNQLEMHIKDHLKHLNGVPPDSIMDLYKKDEGSEFIILIHKGNYVGSCRYFTRSFDKLGRIGKVYLPKKNYVKLNNLFVIPRYRRMGLGRKIMENIINDDTNYLLRVEKVNVGAIKLYEEVGFKKVNTDRSKYSTYVKHSKSEE